MKFLGQDVDVLLNQLHALIANVLSCGLFLKLFLGGNIRVSFIHAGLSAVVGLSFMIPVEYVIYYMCRC